MKAIIVETNKKYAVVLDKNGAFIKVRNNGNFVVGSEIELPSKPVVNMSTLQKLSSAAAAVLLFVSLGLGVYGYTTPYSYITIDINPSIEITTNMFDRIIKIEALNADAVKILNNTDLKNKTINEGIDIVINNATNTGYLTDESKNAVMITVSGKNEKKADEIKKSIEVEAKTELEAEKVKAEILVENVNVQKHDEARKAGISPGKMLLIERLQQLDPKAKVEEYKDAPVKQIMKNIQAAKKLKKSEKKEDKEDKEKNEGRDGKASEVNSNVQGEKVDGEKTPDKASKPDVHNKNEEIGKKSGSKSKNNDTEKTVKGQNGSKAGDKNKENDKYEEQQKQIEKGEKNETDDKDSDEKNLKEEDPKEKKDKNWKWDKQKKGRD